MSDTSGMSALSTPSLAIAIPLANVRRDPDLTAEVVTQALCNVAAEPLETQGEWARIRLSDYEGWVRSSELAASATPQPWLATVTALRTPLYAAATGDAVRGQVYATTTLPASSSATAASSVPTLSERVAVALPGGEQGWLASSAVSLRPVATVDEADPATAVAVARRLLGVPYLWGGTTIEGIDCSGLTQLCCRAAGVNIPRDADQQFEGLPYIVERGNLHMSDLIYFARNGAITHTAIMLDAQHYIHAKGRPESVVMLNTLEPGAADYSEALAAMYAGARRPFAPRARRIMA